MQLIDISYDVFVKQNYFSHNFDVCVTVNRICLYVRFMGFCERLLKLIILFICLADPIERGSCAGNVGLHSPSVTVSCVQV